MLPTNFTLMNIGKIKESTITLNRFTVLCGKNSVGKSFFSKSLFLLYKAVYEYEDWICVEIERKFEECLINLISISRRIPLRVFTRPEFSSLKKKILIYLEEKNFEELLRILSGIREKIEEIKKEIDKSSGQVSLFGKEIINERLYAKIDIIRKKIDYLENILNILKDNPQDILKESFTYFIKSIFKGNICKYDADGISKITLGNNYLELRENKIVRVECSGLLRKNKSNVIFIESPFIIEIFEQLAKLTKSAIPFLMTKKRYEKYILPYHIEDLINQIREYEFFLGEELNFSKKIEQITKGKLEYAPLKEEITFREGKHKIPVLNTASGILTFGVLHLLLKSGAFDENVLLIFEEPETNLHPEWQIKIVEVLKSLMEEIGIQIFLTTHSPFIVKALEVIALEDKNFKKSLSINLIYEDGKTVCDFEESIEKIYDQLLGPFSTLMFRSWFYE